MKKIISLILLVTASCVCFADKLDSLESAILSEIPCGIRRMW